MKVRLVDLYVCPEPDCGRTYPDQESFARHCDYAEHGQEPEPATFDPGPYIGSYAASDPWSDARDNRRDD